MRGGEEGSREIEQQREGPGTKKERCSGEIQWAGGE